MAEGEWYRTGGIRSLLALIDEHGEALEADLIKIGLRLRYCPVAWFDWLDLLTVVRFSAAESNLYRSMHPEEAGWTLTNHLLATIADVLRWLQWAKTPDGRKNRNRPEPISRPGVASKKRSHPKVNGAPLSKMRELLNRGRESPADRTSRIRNLFKTGRYD